MRPSLTHHKDFALLSPSFPHQNGKPRPSGLSPYPHVPGGSKPDPLLQRDNLNRPHRRQNNVSSKMENLLAPCPKAPDYMPNCTYDLELRRLLYIQDMQSSCSSRFNTVRDSMQNLQRSQNMLNQCGDGKVGLFNDELPPTTERAWTNGMKINQLLLQESVSNRSVAIPKADVTRLNRFFLPSVRHGRDQLYSN